MTKIIKQQLSENAAFAEAFLKQLANKNRLMILCCLLDKEMSVTELNDNVSLTQSALSQHLASLRDANMVATRRQSQTIYYRLNDHNVALVIKQLHKIFCQ